MFNTVDYVESLIAQGVAIAAEAKDAPAEFWDEYTPRFVKQGPYKLWRARVMNFANSLNGEEHRKALETTLRAPHESVVLSANEILAGIAEDLNAGVLAFKTPAISSTLTVLERLFDRFHLVANQLEHRHDKRPFHEINDEYDVQDLLHALLRIDFDDVRDEEWNPSHSGRSTRGDLLLKREKLVVEVKMTRKALKDAALGDELNLDIARYRSNPGIDTFVAFVYNPGHFLSNPDACERDLTDPLAAKPTHVFVRPK